MDFNNTIFLFSKYSSGSQHFINIINSMPYSFKEKMKINFLCIDNEQIRSAIIKSKKINIKYVPCILITQANGSVNKYEGNEAFMWVNNKLSESMYPENLQKFQKPSIRQNQRIYQNQDQQPSIPQNQRIYQNQDQQQSPQNQRIYQNQDQPSRMIQQNHRQPTDMIPQHESQTKNNKPSEKDYEENQKENKEENINPKAKQTGKSDRKHLTKTLIDDIEEEEEEEEEEMIDEYKHLYENNKEKKTVKEEKREKLMNAAMEMQKSREDIDKQFKKIPEMK